MLDQNISPTPQGKLSIPPILAYVHRVQPSAPLIRRVDTAKLLLAVSLSLAKLESVEDVGRQASSPFAHTSKVAYPAGIAQKTTVTRGDCLLAENATVEEKSVIKESVIGANCHIQKGSRLTRCVLMDGAVVGERCQLSGCIIGRRSKIGRESVLKDCEVQDGNVVPNESEWPWHPVKFDLLIEFVADAKDQQFMVFEGLDDEGEENMEEGLPLG
jgi:translation initiation factor eIF-2B subunit gamma